MYREAVEALVAARTQRKSLEERQGIQSQVDAARVTCENRQLAISRHRITHRCDPFWSFTEDPDGTETETHE
jgi:hypothetical protein